MLTLVNTIIMGYTLHPIILTPIISISSLCAKCRSHPEEYMQRECVCRLRPFHLPSTPMLWNNLFALSQIVLGFIV
jgi:hypothetical protein